MAMKELWKGKSEKPIELEEETGNPKCPVCSKNMLKKTFKDGTIGWVLDCDCIVSNKRLD